MIRKRSPMAEKMRDKIFRGGKRPSDRVKLSRGIVNEPLSSASEIVATKAAPPPATKLPRATAKRPKGIETITLGPGTLTLPDGTVYKTGPVTITLTKEPE